MTPTIDHYAIEQASLRARLLCTTAGFPWAEMDDAQQELLLDYLRRSPKFDSGRGDRNGFVRGVMRNHATVLIARRSRRVRHEVLMDDVLEPVLDETSDVLEIVSRRDPTVAFHVSLDVERVLQKLPRRLQHVASLLADTPIAEICMATGKSRSWVYQTIRRLRSAFAEAGLRHARPTLGSHRCGVAR